MDAFVYQRAIDQETYKDQLDKLNEGMVLAEMEQHGQRTEELDIEAVLDFAERVALNAARLWLEANLEQRQRFQAPLIAVNVDDEALARIIECMQKRPILAVASIRRDPGKTDSVAASPLDELQRQSGLGL